MVQISEVFPNPAGKDTGNEWIELYNAGTQPISLQGWSIKDAVGKTYYFTSEKIESNSFLVLESSVSKIALNNSSEKIFLYDTTGKLVDTMEYAFSVGDDVAVIRVENRIAMGSSTKGYVNAVPGPSVESAQAVPDRIGRGIGSMSIILTALIIGMLLSFVMLYLFKHVEKICAQKAS